MLLFSVVFYANAWLDRSSYSRTIVVVDDDVVFIVSGDHQFSEL